MFSIERFASITSASFSFARATMAGVVVFCTLAALRGEASHASANALGAAVNSIAYLHYNRMAEVHSKGESVWDIRFSDWVATLPLMVVELHRILGASAASAIPGAICSVFMVLLGAAAYPFDPLRYLSMLFFIASSILLVVIYVLGIFQMYDRDGVNVAIAAAFWAPWALYGAAFALKAPDLCYNLLDVLTKCGLALTVAFISLDS